MTERAEAVHRYVLDYLSRHMRRLGLDDGDLDDLEDTNLVAAGILDSIGFIELLAAVEDEFGVEVDLDRYDPSVFTTLSGFVRCVAESGA